MPAARRIVCAAAAVLCLTLASCSEDEKKPAASELGGDDGGELTDEDLYGPELTVDEVVEQARPIVDNNGAPGVVLLVRRGDEVRTLVHGFADVDTKRELTGEARMWIGSISKPMLSTAVLRLVEQGELSLDDSVETWLPGLLPDGRDITVRMLLAHRSGLFDYTDVPHFDFAARRTPEDLVALSTAHPLLFRPGHLSAYSNTNFVVLGLLLEKVTGKPLDTVLDDLVFRPSGMESTEHQETPVGGAEVHGYSRKRDVTIDVPWGAWGAGMVTSTAADLDAFLAALVDGDLVHGDLLRLMEHGRPIQGALTGYTYGLGLLVWDSRCGLAVGHSGAIPGFEAEAWRTEDGERAAVVLTNGLPSRTQGLADVALCG